MIIRIAILFWALLSSGSCFAGSMLLLGAGTGVPAGPLLTLTGPTSGAVSVPSTNFTVTFTGGTFNGSQTVTITEGTPGTGTITPSCCGTTGVTPRTITPTTGLTSFTFTYTPNATPATINISMTNSASVPESGSPIAYVTSGAGGCSQATSTLGRLTTTGENTSAMTTMICGMVTDGNWALLDALYVFTVFNSGNTAINWISSSYPLTVGAAGCTFTANMGLTGNSACYYTTPFIPSTAGGQFSLNSASMGTCILTAPGAGSTYYPVGGYDGASAAQLAFQNNTNIVYYLNDVGGASFTWTTGLGSWIATRTTAPLFSIFQNGTSAGTAPISAVSLESKALYVMGTNNNGSVTGPVNNQIGYVFWGSGAINVSQMYSRLSTYMTAAHGSATGC